ncbi:hypothetical protein BKM31_52000 [[Actinomadura] parvosata subsp. kistnae]|uniref:Serine/threonine protein kinase n=1 Tax=[Actinomadura] parvosata subsp. kistnae TaxID=1909395 RepID=A0A1V0AFA8_9ACTN|nr:hypothetical protein [Nonomuraea sp. ATCC 55076]AQZ68873.1 hypothetical protein BKM31_52000 [Nonomuraea sp. ATCC 55076]
MSRLGPVITLAAGAVLAVGLGVASTIATPAAEETAAGTAAQAPPSEESSAAASPSPSKTEPEKIAKADYGGRVKGNGALIAISIRNGKAVGYFCDGRSEAWFKGSESGGELQLKGVANAGAKVTAELGGGRAKGWVSVGGRKWDFVAPTVVKPSGLYRATALVRGAKLRAGWIVIKNPDGGYYQVGAAALGEQQVAIPRLDSERPTAPVTVDGTTVSPEDVDGFIEEMQ